MFVRPTFERYADEIVRLYLSGKSSLEVANVLGLSKAFVLKCLKKHGTPTRSMSDAKRKYQFDQQYFDDLKTDEKAYWFGFICADGHNSSRGLTIRINKKDIELLEKFKESICTEAVFTPEKKKPNMVFMNINSRKLSIKLTEIGCMERKSYKFEWPKVIHGNMIAPFLRGFFDGNGSISRKDARNPKITFASTIKFCTAAQQIIQDSVGVTAYVEIPKNHAETCAVLSINGRGQLLKVMDWLYTDATIFLRRKFERYVDLKKRPVKKTWNSYSNTEIAKTQYN